MTEDEIRANVEISHRIARVSKIMVVRLGMTPSEMFQLSKLVHIVKSYEDIPEHFRAKVEEAEKIAEGSLGRPRSFGQQGHDHTHSNYSSSPSSPHCTNSASQPISRLTSSGD